VKTENSFAVSRYENCNGDELLACRRLRKLRSNLPCCRPPLAFDLRPRFSNDDQLREAESAFRRLADQRRLLSVYLDLAPANFRGPESDMALSEAVSEYTHDGRSGDWRDARCA
jgi:hypothetical protein